jgi:signal transduction histidine kinase
MCSNLDITDQKLCWRGKQEFGMQYLVSQQVDHLKSEFLANMSHEFRTPLNTIIGFAGLLHEESVGPLSDEQKACLTNILASSMHLLRMISDVLDLVNIEAGSIIFQHEPVDLAALVAGVQEMLRPLADRKRLQTETDIDSSLKNIVLDPAYFRQVLYQYLANAIKFTPDGGRIRVCITPESFERFRIEVEDTGIGIRPEDLRRLFVEFQPLDASKAKRYQGAGVGLALTRHLVEAQGGFVGVQSLPGKGSTFFAVLPRVACESTSDT